MATLLGVLAIVLGLIGTFVAGWIGVVIAVILGGLAIFFRIKKNKESEEGPKKIGAIICGCVGIVISLLLQLGLGSFATKLKETADEMGDVPFVSAGAEGFKSTGLIGFVTKAMDAKPADMSDTEFGDVLKEQFDKVSKKMTNK